MTPVVYPKTALIAVGDTHINSTVGLAPRVFNLDDGGTFHGSRTQHWLWDCWLDFCAEAKVLTEGYRRIAVFNGDIVELDTLRRSNQLITGNKSTILAMAADTIAPLVEFTDANIFMRGTAAHVGKSSWAEEELARDTEGTVRPKNKIKSGSGNPAPYSWWHFQGTASGVRLDICHHAKARSTPWNKKMSATALAAEILWHYKVEQDAPAPDLVIRSHNHFYSTSGDNYKTLVDFLPSWTTLTEYGYRVNLENDLADIGGIVYLLEGGRIRKHEILFQPKGKGRPWLNQI